MMVGICERIAAHNDVITDLAETQASDSTVIAIAGHVSPKMLQHSYTFAFGRSKLP
jgi:hypothetical protein